MATCEDYPACGHTDGLGCDWTYTEYARAYDERHAFCEHEHGFCELEDEGEEEDEDEELTEDDWLADMLNREAEEESLGRPLFPNEY